MNSAQKTRVWHVLEWLCRGIVAAIFLLIAGAWTVALVRNYNPATQTTRLPRLGTSLQLGENENEGGEGGEGGGREQRKQHDDDD